jgi:hypothetical protein
MLIAVLLAIAVLVQAPAAQEAAPAAAPSALKARLRISVVKIDAPPAAPAEHPYGQLGALLARTLAPEGAVDIEYVVAGDSMRADVQGRLATLPRGSIVLQRVGEPVLRILNPGNRTWYELSTDQNPGALLGAPDVQVEPTSDTTMIVGHRAQRFRFAETLQLPAAEGVTLPPDFPRELQFTGDLWSTDAFAGSAYSNIFRTLQAFAAVPGMEALTAGGRFPLRLHLRSTFMPGYELRSEVTSIGPAQPDPSLFVVPADYQKVQSPVGGAPVR